MEQHHHTNNNNKSTTFDNTHSNKHIIVHKYKYYYNNNEYISNNVMDLIDEELLEKELEQPKLGLQQNQTNIDHTYQNNTCTTTPRLNQKNTLPIIITQAQIPRGEVKINHATDWYKTLHNVQPYQTINNDHAEELLKLSLIHI